VELNLTSVCRTGVKHDFEGWDEKHRIMLHDKTWSLTLTPPLLKNGFGAPGSTQARSLGDPQFVGVENFTVPFMPESCEIWAVAAAEQQRLASLRNWVYFAWQPKAGLVYR